MNISEDGKISQAHGLVGLIMKMATLLKAIYRFYAIPFKTPTQFFFQTLKEQFSMLISTYL